jgi:hypothetical protein
MIIKEDKWSAFGHYQIDTLTEPVYSMRIAHEHMLQGHKVHFNFHDKLLGSARTNVEPKWSLDQLYSRRVSKLREKYDYLILLYSGGADSHNILKYFQHTDTKLDEIVSYDDSSYRGKTSPISSEVFGVALPEVQQHLLKYPDTIFRQISLRDVQQKLFTDQTFGFDVYKDITYNMQPIGIKHAYGLCYVDHYKKLHDSGLKIGVIHGIDKPKLAIDPIGKWMMYFNDWSSQFGHKHYYRNFPFYDEFFYWTPDDPWIAIKQAHLVSKHLDYLDSIKFNSDYRIDQRANVLPRKSGIGINWEWVHHVIYPFWNRDTYSAGKNAENFIASNRDPTLSNFNDEMLLPYKKSVDAAMQLASKVSPFRLKHITDKDDDTIIGVAPFRSMYHPIE